MSLAGKFAVSASDDHTLKIWNYQTGKLITTFYADASLECVAIAENFERIVAGDGGDSVHFLRSNAALLRVLRGE